MEVSSQGNQPLGKCPLSIAHMLEHTKGLTYFVNIKCIYFLMTNQDAMYDTVPV